VKSCHRIYLGATRHLRAQRMDTFTFRVPDSLAGRLSSVQMRAWLADFLRQPHILPGDPGSGEERVSLTLPSEAVRHAATFLRCSQSVALRRIATERLAISFSAAAVHQEAIAGRPGGRQSSIPANFPTQPVSGSSFRTTLLPPFHPVSSVRQLSRNSEPVRRIFGVEILFSLIPTVFFLGWLLFAFRGNSKTE